MGGSGGPWWSKNKNHLNFGSEYNEINTLRIIKTLTFMLKKIKFRLINDP